MSQASGSNHRQRNKVVSVRLMPNEEAALKTRADEAGQTVGAYLRIAVLGGAGPRALRRPPRYRVDCVRLLGKLGAVATALRDVESRDSRCGDAVTEAQWAEVRDAIFEVRDLLVEQLRP